MSTLTVRPLVCTAAVAAALVGLSVMTSVAVAEDAERERIFLTFEGDASDALEREALKFQGPVAGADVFEFAGTSEMEVLYAACGEEIGVNATTRRDCQLRAANRIMVTQVLQLSGDQVDEKTWDVALEVWSPETNGLLWGDTIEVEAKSLRRAAREALPELADRYLCWRGIESACPSQPVATAAPVGTPLTDSPTPTPVETTPTPAETTPTPVDAPDGMVHVPAGTFWMGCSSEVDSGCRGDESPVREVHLDGYVIDTHEVTVEAYTACVEAGGCTAPAMTHSDYETYNWGAAARSNHPVNGVTWSQASSFCGWTGKRLPTEAEWEKAARGTDGRVYPWGNASPSCAYAVMDDGGGKGCGQSTTLPVGSRPAGVSPYGAHDMVGNVAEWVGDWYDEGSYDTAADSNPSGPSSGTRRVLRGGGLDTDAAFARAAGRDAGPPTSDYDIQGFRCARSASEHPTSLPTDAVPQSEPHEAEQ